MPADITYRSVLTWESNVGDDTYAWDFHHRGNAANTVDEDAGQIRVGIEGALVTTGAGMAVSQMMSQGTSATARLRVYNLADDRPRIPLRDVAVDSLAGGLVRIIDTVPLPEEVSVALSYRAHPTSGVARGRSRGHVRIGPLNSAALSQDGLDGPSIVNDNMRNAAKTFGLALYDAGVGGGTPWVVFSPTSAGPLPALVGGVGRGYTLAELAVSFSLITEVRVDHDFDTSRRRGTQRAKPAWTMAD